MEETSQPDQDPAPLKHSDAERVTGKEAGGGEQNEPADTENDQASPGDEGDPA